MKLFKKIALVSIGAMMAISAGVLIAQPSIKGASAASGTVTLSAGTSGGAPLAITWAETYWTVVQNKGFSGTAVNADFISAPRMYKGHFLTFEAPENITFNSIVFAGVSGSLGSDMTCGASTSSGFVPSGDGTAAPANANITLSVAGTTVTANLSSVPNAKSVFVQNSYNGASSYTQFRFTAVTIDYTNSGVEVLPTSVSVSFDSSSIDAGSTTQATATVGPENATNKTVTWESSNTSVAIVSAAGVVTGLTAGTADITATCNGDPTVYNDATITVNALSCTAVDKGITALRLGYTNSYSNNVASLEGIVYGRVDALWSAANDDSIQLKASTGKFFNITAYPTAIQTLIVSFSVSNANDPSNFAVYAGTSAGDVSTPITASVVDRVYTYDFSGSTYNYFTLAKTGSFATYASSIEVQLAGDLAVNTRTWAQSFLSDLVCDASGANAPSTSSWSTLAGSFAALTTDEKNAILDCSYHTSELQANVGSALDRAVERYDYVLGKYGTTNYTNFLSRTIVSLSAPVIIGSLNTARNTAILVLVVVSFSVLVAAVNFLLKKKKEDR